MPPSMAKRILAECLKRKNIFPSIPIRAKLEILELRNH